MRQASLFLFLGLNLTIQAQLPDYVPTDGLIGYYSLNGNGNDDGPQASDGQLHGPVGAVDRFGEDGGCIAFDGLDDFGSIPHSPGWNNLPGLSVSLWFNWESHPTNYQYCGGGTGAYSALVNKWASSNESRTFELMLTNWGLGSTPSESGYLSACHSGGCWDNVESWDDFPLNAWNHLCVVYGEDSGSVYVNGVVHHSSATLATPDGLPSAGNEILFGDFPNVSCDRSFDGKMDDLAFWNRPLSSEEVMTLFLGEAPVMGCTNPQACNFNAEANVNDGSCYSCEIPAAHCGVGTYWDTESQSCLIANSSDTNFDGCVSMTDLLDLLSVFGTCNEVPWSCGDQLEYQGYDYETVQIGEQCWFAENLRVENYRNGDVIPAGLSDSEWFSTTSGAAAVYGEDSGCEDYSPDFDACSAEASLEVYGRHYNHYAVDDSRGLCPSGWHVPTDGEWTVITNELGGDSVAGGTMMTTSGWNNGGHGNNSSGLSGLPAGNRYNDGHFYYAGKHCFWWSSSSNGVNAWYRVLSSNSDVIDRFDADPRDGFSVRCVRDSE